MEGLTLIEVMQGWRGGLKALKLWNGNEEKAYKQIRKILQVKKGAMLVTGEFVQRWRQEIINNLQTQDTRDWEDLITEMLEELGLKVF